MKRLGERPYLKEMIYEARFEDLIRVILNKEDSKVLFINYFVEDLMKPLDDETEAIQDSVAFWKERILSILDAKNLHTISDREKLKELVTEAVDKNPKVVGDIKNGKENARNALVGYVMKKTNGRANPRIVNELVLQI